MIGTLLLRRTSENATLAIVGIALLTQAPLLTALGATMGALPALLSALFLGRRHEAAMPMRRTAATGGTILTCTAIACAIRALGFTGA